MGIFYKKWTMNYIHNGKFFYIFLPGMLADSKKFSRSYQALALSTLLAQAQPLLPLKAHRELLKAGRRGYLHW
ncbi:hypothetical protein H2C83_09845 [Thermoactinomyces sp. AMNI-1]|uniref:Uncharacterized protein n=2 Tax=Thermoactinomyces mirandus TaxID=2756294 RepID=A0A7W1XSX8_9BACL|nr:hypothetical protein [Thermoactinomyces mirandus]